MDIDREETELSEDAVPLEERVMDVVDRSSLTIRPGRLAAELGLSVNDACAELCVSWRLSVEAMMEQPFILNKWKARM